MDDEVSRIVLIAKSDVAAGDELTYNSVLYKLHPFCLIEIVHQTLAFPFYSQYFLC